MMEKLCTLFGVLCILLVAARGSEARALKSMLSTVIFFFGMVLTTRYWEIGTELLTGFGLSEPIAAPLWFLFIMGAYLLVFAANLEPWIAGKFSKMVMYPVLDRILGFLFGLAGGFLMMTTIFMVAMIPMVKWGNYDAGLVPYRLDEQPLKIYRWMNKQFTGEQVLPGSNTFPERILISSGSTNILPQGQIGFDQRTLPDEFKE